ncbi:hypothetical protein FOZ63_008232, partial [Perkinsus olseni]
GSADLVSLLYGMTTTARDRPALRVLLPEQFQRAEARNQLLKETCKHQRNPIDPSVVKGEGCKAMLDSMYKDDSSQFLAAVTRVADAPSSSSDEMRGEINLVFWFCAHYGRVECMKVMQEKLPVDLNYVHRCGHSVITRAALNDHVAVVEWLLSVGADHTSVTDPKFLVLALHCGAQHTVDFLRGYAGTAGAGLCHPAAPIPMEGVASDTPM